MFYIPELEAKFVMGYLFWSLTFRSFIFVSDLPALEVSFLEPANGGSAVPFGGLAAAKFRFIRIGTKPGQSKITNYAKQTQSCPPLADSK